MLLGTKVARLIHYRADLAVCRQQPAVAGNRGGVPILNDSANVRAWVSPRAYFLLTPSELPLVDDLCFRSSSPRARHSRIAPNVVSPSGAAVQAYTLHCLME